MAADDLTTPAPNPDEPPAVTPEVPAEPADPTLQEGAAAPESDQPEVQPAPAETTVTTEAPEGDAAPPSESTPADETQIEASNVLAFGCEHCEVVTFIGKKRHPNAGGQPAIPRGVICPICGNNMPMREPIVLSAAFEPQAIVDEVASNA